MKYFTVAAFALVLFVAASPVNAAETKCKGDALKEKPPVPNYPHHIRNVVWRNTRAMCLEELAQQSTNTTNLNPAPTQPSSK